MLDLFTVRVVQASVAVCVVLLFYFVTYRQTRSRFAFYWTLIVLLSGVAAGLYLLNDTPASAVANPVANALGVLVAGLVWAACLAFTSRKVPWWTLAVGPVIALIAGLIDDPDTNDWAGGEVLLGGVALYLGLASHALWSTRDTSPTLHDRRTSDEGVRAIVTSMAIMATAFAVYYAWRLALFVAVGPDDALFVTYAGGVPTAIALILLNVVATFAMTSLSAAERMNDLRERAATDGLTGLATRTEFMDQATRLHESSPQGWRYAAVVADLDHFKALNDTHGHAAGDAALRRFGEICQRVIGAGEVAGRIGGEEFALLLDGADAKSVEAVTTTIARLYAAHSVASDATPLTVSFGVALPMAPESVEEALRRADEALYRAKAAGRARVEFA